MKKGEIAGTEKLNIFGVERRARSPPCWRDPHDALFLRRRRRYHTAMLEVSGSFVNRFPASRRSEPRPSSTAKTEPVVEPPAVLAGYAIL